MNIIQRLIPVSHTETRPGIKMVPKYITIHETDNTARGADAVAHASLQERGNSRTASWHLQVDEHEIIQSIPFDEVAWAAGDGRNGPGNRTSIHIEMCVNVDGNYKQTVTNTVELVQYLMSRFNISIDHVVPHKHWTGKNCPRNLLPQWESFIKRLQGTNDGWVKKGTQWFFYKDGIKQTGWLNQNGKWYFLDATGLMNTGWTRVKGLWYFLNTDGVMQTGWVKVQDKWYFLNANGVMQTGWVKVKDKWYYLSDNGVMQKGWLEINNKKYYLMSDGSMRTGWLKLDSKWYFFNTNGEMAVGWVQDNGKTYYLNADGVMVTGKQTIDGVEYTFGDDGVLIEAQATSPANDTSAGGAIIAQDTSMTVAPEGNKSEAVTTRSVSANPNGAVGNPAGGNPEGTAGEPVTETPEGVQEVPINETEVQANDEQTP
ncbi:N-acetylmuramoyl-L-alanine amidase [Neobacillus drentensis]|uniref:N-acetylmuramoyl-L-alanine amidase n=1 Tax=Neobacillus drentensis TaxID=220684 RepID=UPI002FFF5789